MGTTTEKPKPVCYRYFKLKGELYDLAREFIKKENDWAQKTNKLVAQHGADAWSLSGDFPDSLLIYAVRDVPDGMIQRKDFHNDRYKAVVYADKKKQSELRRELKKMKIPKPPTKLIKMIEEIIGCNLHSVFVRGSDGMNYFVNIDPVDLDGDIYVSLLDPTRTNRIDSALEDEPYRVPESLFEEVSESSYEDLLAALKKASEVSLGKKVAEIEKSIEFDKERTRLVCDGVAGSLVAIIQRELDSYWRCMGGWTHNGDPTAYAKANQSYIARTYGLWIEEKDAVSIESCAKALQNAFMFFDMYHRKAAAFHVVLSFKNYLPMGLSEEDRDTPKFWACVIKEFYMCEVSEEEVSTFEKAVISAVNAITSNPKFVWRFPDFSHE